MNKFVCAVTIFLVLASGAAAQYLAPALDSVSEQQELAQLHAQRAAHPERWRAYTDRFTGQPARAFFLPGADGDRRMEELDARRVAPAVQVAKLPTWRDSRVVFVDGASGSFVDLGGKTYILSCAHRTARISVPVGERVEYQCHDGATGTATAIAVDPLDLDSEPLRDSALFEVNGEVDPRYKRFRLSCRQSRPGDKVWVCGFPLGRAFTSRSTRVLSDNGTLTIAGQSTPGESGGPIVNTEGEIVGTLTASVSGSDGRTLCCSQAVHWQLCQRYCGPGGCCPSGGCPTITGPIYQPPRPPARPPINPPLPAPPPVPTPVAGPPGPPGPVGDKGPTGDKGPAGDASACGCAGKWEALDGRLTKIEASIAALATQQPPAPTKPPSEEHVVVVADHNAPYWQRLAEAIANTKKTYSGVQDTTLPSFPIGVHPQAVVYRNSVPVRVVKGQYEVEALLSRLARGEPI